MRRWCVVAMGVVAAVMVAGCQGGGARTPSATASPSPSVSRYVPPPLPVNCAVVLDRLPRGLVRNLRPATNETSSPGDDQLLCSFFARSPDGGMEVYAQVDTLAMRPNPFDPRMNNLPEWQRSEVHSAPGAPCDNTGKVVPGTARYTVQCHASEPDGAFTARGSAGEDGRVVRVKVTVSGTTPSVQARRFADRVAAAVVDAGLAAR